MTSIRLKFRPSTIPGKEGSLVFQLIQGRSVRRITSEYKIFAEEWDDKAGKILLPAPSSPRYAFLAFLKAELQYMYSFMGDVYNMMGNPEEAEDYYRKSIVNLPETSTYDKVYSGICYSMFLMQHRRFDEALSQLKRSEKLMTDNDIPTFRKELYANMSGIYEHKGDFENALAYYKMYVEIKDELLSAETMDDGVVWLRYKFHR